MDNELVKLRKEIEEIDNKIFEFITKRMDVSKRIGKFKKKSGEVIEDKGRERILVDRILGEYDLPIELVEEIYAVFFKHSKIAQKKG